MGAYHTSTIGQGHKNGIGIAMHLAVVRQLLYPSFGHLLEFERC
jgi:hypothetical protein